MFEFEGNIYKQIRGTAMGTPMAPTIANIFMRYPEEKVFKKSIINHKNIIWKRYIDDIFLIWPGSNDELLSFIKVLNASHKTIKFTYEASDKELSFLDIKMTKKRRHNSYRYTL